jgi:hypothetical protein
MSRRGSVRGAAESQRFRAAAATACSSSAHASGWGAFAYAQCETFTQTRFADDGVTPLGRRCISSR